MTLYPESNKEVNKNYIPPASTRRRDLIDRGQINYTWWELPNGKFSDGVTLQSVIHTMPTVEAVEVARVKEAKQYILQVLDTLIETDRPLYELETDNSYYGGKLAAFEIVRRLVNAALIDLCMEEVS